MAYPAKDSEFINTKEATEYTIIYKYRDFFVPINDICVVTIKLPQIPIKGTPEQEER